MNVGLLSSSLDALLQRAKREGLHTVTLDYHDEYDGEYFTRRMRISFSAWPRAFSVQWHDVRTTSTNVG